MSVLRFSELACREVIGLPCGKRLGYISDLELDVQCGKIISILLPEHRGLKGAFSRSEYRVRWQDIVTIGQDLIFVNSWEKHSDFEKKNE